MFLARLVANVRSPLELALYLWYSIYRQGGVQVHLISVASLNFPVLAVMPVSFSPFL